MGRPIIQYPQDMVAMQELIWQIKPDLIIETGIAHGGSLIFSASMLALLDMCDAIESGTVIDPKRSNRKVLGIDIDIRAHNRAAIEAHPMASRIQMIQGSSIAPEIIEQVAEVAKLYNASLSASIQTTLMTTCLPNWKPMPRSCRLTATVLSSIPSSKTCPPTCSPIVPGGRATTLRPLSLNT